MKRTGGGIRIKKKGMKLAALGGVGGGRVGVHERKNKNFLRRERGGGGGGLLK